MTKFFEEFVKTSEGAFPELKLHSATYLRDKHELQVRFIISAFAIRGYDKEKMAEVLECLQKILPGLKVEVQYIRTYADDTVVKNKIIEYFNKNQQMIFRRLSEENITLNVSDKEIFVKLTFETPTFKLLDAANCAETLKDFLDTNFNQDIEVSLVEKVVDLSTLNNDAVVPSPIFQEAQSLRLIKISTGEKVYSKWKIGGINQLPNYISDIKNPADNVILCGKISNISKSEYKNKKHDPENTRSGPEKLPLVKFYLDDTTSKIEGVCFPRPEDVDSIMSLGQNDQVVCVGSVTISNYSNSPSLTASAIFRCSIDFDSIQDIKSKPTPTDYSIVRPKPYEGQLSQSSMFEENKTATAYLKNKTFVVFDFEATDKDIMNAEPIELAAAKVVNGKITELFQTLIKPKATISQFITELTGIDNDMVKNSPKMEDILPDFYLFTRGSVLVGHNISGYDYPLLKKYADQCGYYFDNDMDDTLLLARATLREYKKFDLVSLSNNLGISHENAHRATADVLATVELLKVIASRI